MRECDGLKKKGCKEISENPRRKTKKVTAKRKKLPISDGRPHQVCSQISRDKSGLVGTQKPRSLTGTR